MKYTIEGHWDTYGFISMDSDPRDEYELYLDAVKSGCFGEDEFPIFSLDDFRDYIQKLKDYEFVNS